DDLGDLQRALRSFGAGQVARRVDRDLARAGAARPMQVGGQVARDPEQPGAHRPIGRAQRRSGPPRPQEGLLDDVLRQLTIAREPLDIAAQGMLVERHDRAPLAILGPARRPDVVVLHLHWRYPAIQPPKPWFAIGSPRGYPCPPV